MMTTIWCDGACSPNPGLGGWAYLVCAKGEEPIGDSGGVKDTTNNRMELKAAIEGIKSIPKNSSAELITDSRYLCEAFRKDWISRWIESGWMTEKGTPVKNEDLWKELISLCEERDIAWAWTKGHANDEMNEACDKMAVDARLSLVD